MALDEMPPELVLLILRTIGSTPSSPPRLIRVSVQPGGNAGDSDLEDEGAARDETRTKDERLAHLLGIDRPQLGWSRFDAYSRYGRRGGYISWQDGRRWPLRERACVFWDTERITSDEAMYMRLKAAKKGKVEGNRMGVYVRGAWDTESSEERLEGVWMPWGDMKNIFMDFGCDGRNWEK